MKNPDSVSNLQVLTASIAHEVKQPLSGILTNAGTCLRMLSADPPNVDGARETAQRTIRDVNRAAEVIDRVRALFAKRTLEPEFVDLNETVLHVLTLCRNELEAARISVQFHLADDVPVLLGDPVQLQQVVFNLVKNAIEAMRDAHGRPAELTITTWQDADGGGSLSVHDVGDGIAPCDAERLFQPFYTTKPDGMGMGLCICRSIAERHGGTLRVTSNDGPGVTFRLSIPSMVTGPSFEPDQMPITNRSASSKDHDRPSAHARSNAPSPRNALRAAAT